MLHAAATIVAEALGLPLEHFPEDEDGLVEMYQYDFYTEKGKFASKGEIACVQLFTATRRVNFSMRAEVSIDIEDEQSHLLDYGSLDELRETMKYFVNERLAAQATA